MFKNLFSKSENKKPGFGTAPVFFTAISTILGAILFLRFGFAAGELGFWGVFMNCGMSKALRQQKAFILAPPVVSLSENPLDDFFLPDYLDIHIAVLIL